jgi:hypothetical protein
MAATGRAVGSIYDTLAFFACNLFGLLACMPMERE